MEELGLKNKVVVVTGASRGIGAALSRRFAELGLQVASCARGEVEGGLEFPERRLHRQLDVRDAAALDAFADEVAERFGPVDLWINNAGVLDPIGKVADLEAEAFQRLIEINVNGVFNGCRSFLSRWRDRAGGCLVNIGSGAARGAYQGWGAYCASKAAVLQLSRVIALENPELRVHCLAPGVIETGMQTLIRQQTEASFPDVKRFVQLYDEGHLLHPESPVAPILRLAFGAERVAEVELDARSSEELQELGAFEALRPN